VGLDSFLAHFRRRPSGRNLPAREVSKGAARILDPEIRLALLDGLRWAGVASHIVCYAVHSTVDGEALMTSAFRKISRVTSLTGGTKWYLSEDCLLAAKRMMYAVEYRRFYFRDLESVVVWPSRLWPLRLIIPAAVLAAIGASFWVWVNATAGEIFVGMGVAWVILELALGPTAKSRVRTTGSSVDLPLVQRTRRAAKVLEAIDEAVRASRDASLQSGISVPSPQQPGIAVQTKTEAASAAHPIGDPSQANAI
jgi:hypothetical protein